MTQGENIRKELEEIAPEIHGRLPSPDFNVPDGYFRNFAFKTLDRIHSEEKAEENEFRHKFPKRNVYAVPEGYFAGTPQKVLEKIQNRRSAIPLPRRRKYQSGWAVAACMAAFVALAGILTMPKNTTQKPLDSQLANISENAIEQYLNNHLSPLNSEEIYDYITTSDVENAITHNLSTQDIQEYLEDNADNL